MLRRVEPGDVTEFGSEHGTEHRTDPRDRLDRFVAGMPFELRRDPCIELGQFGDVELDESP
jgi:hypothetical protein